MCVEIISTVAATCGIRNICKKDKGYGCLQIATAVAAFVLGCGFFWEDIALMLGTATCCGLVTSGIEHLMDKKIKKGFFEIMAGLFSANATAFVVNPVTSFIPLLVILKKGAMFGALAIAFQNAVKTKEGPLNLIADVEAPFGQV